MLDLIVKAAKPVAFVGGAKVDRQSLNILQKLTDILIAADGGADTLLSIGVMPSHVIGDMDSISAQTRRKLADRIVQISEQDTTDLEKVLTRVAAPVMVGAGFLGGRLDHTFAALNVMARFSDKSLILISETDCCLRCPDAGLQIALPPGTDFGVLPMDQLRATSNGLRWEMQGLPLHPVGFVGSSNKTVSDGVSLQVTGPAVVTVPVAHLDAAIAAVRAG